MILYGVIEHSEAQKIILEIAIALHIRINPCKIPLDLPPLICCLGCAGSDIRERTRGQVLRDNYIIQDLSYSFYLCGSSMCNSSEIGI